MTAGIHSSTLISRREWMDAGDQDLHEKTDWDMTTSNLTPMTSFNVAMRLLRNIGCILGSIKI